MSTSPALRYVMLALNCAILAAGFASIAQALNFWTSDPTFNPYGIDKDTIGIVFAVLGVAVIASLIVLRNTRAVMVTLAASASWVAFWGLTNAKQSFDGVASFQLPILYVELAVLQGCIIFAVYWTRWLRDHH